MSATKLESRARTRLRRMGATLFSAAIGVAIAASALAAETVTLRVGDQKGGNRSLLEISGYAKDLPYKIEWSEFPAAAPILEALNAGALDVGYTGDLSFLTVYAAGAPIKAIGGTRSDARTQAILVRQDSPVKSVANLKGKRLAGTRGGALLVRLNAPPVEGAANAELIALLARTFGVARRAVTIVSGERSRQKRVQVEAFRA